MEETHFDHVARAVAAGASRRRVLGALLAGALWSLRLRATNADEPGTVIAEAGGGGPKSRHRHESESGQRQAVQAGF